MSENPKISALSKTSVIKTLQNGDIFILKKREIIILSMEGIQTWVNLGVMERYIDTKLLIKELNDNGWKRGIRVQGHVQVL